MNFVSFNEKLKATEPGSGEVPICARMVRTIMGQETYQVDLYGNRLETEEDFQQAYAEWRARRVAAMKARFDRLQMFIRRQGWHECCDSLPRSVAFERAERGECWFEQKGRPACWVHNWYTEIVER